MEVHEKVVTILGAFGGLVVGVLLGIVICSVNGLFGNSSDIQAELDGLKENNRVLIEQARRAEEAYSRIESRNRELEILSAEERAEAEAERRARETAEDRLRDIEDLLESDDRDIEAARRILNEALGIDMEEEG